MPTKLADGQSVTGILLVNLGTPDAPTSSAIRQYLQAFLSDSRVIEAPRWIWWLILNLVILRFRPRKLVHNYQRIWKEGESPIRSIGFQQATKLIEKLQLNLPDRRFQVEIAMTYGNPSLEEALDSFAAYQVKKIIVLPLYPQYSATTTAATWDALANCLAKRRDIPGIDFIRNYATHPLYIQGMAQSVRAHWEHTGRKAMLLMSFHGIPKAYVEKGDPYPLECVSTANALANALELKDDEWTMTYQSRVGVAEWLTPYTDDTMKRLGAAKQKGLDVICPGFSSDCLETLEEIDVENRQYFESAGGTDFHYIPALNDSEAQIKLIEAIVRARL
jgi:ferrochelatase